MPAEPQRIAAQDQRTARAEDDAAAAAAFYAGLRARKVPAGAAQAITEAYVSATLGGEAPEPWQAG